MSDPKNPKPEKGKKKPEGIVLSRNVKENPKADLSSQWSGQLLKDFKRASHLQKLGLALEATDDDIEKAYAELCKACRPENFQGTKEEAQRQLESIKAAYKAVKS